MELGLDFVSWFQLREMKKIIKLEKKQDGIAAKHTTKEDTEQDVLEDNHHHLGSALLGFGKDRQMRIPLNALQDVFVPFQYSEVRCSNHHPNHHQQIPPHCFFRSLTQTYLTLRYCVHLLREPDRQSKFVGVPT